MSLDFAYIVYENSIRIRSGCCYGCSFHD
jgi:hypothetical protein